jgi:hypothetical protein
MKRAMTRAMKRASQVKRVWQAGEPVPWSVEQPSPRLRLGLLMRGRIVTFRLRVDGRGLSPVD